MKNLCPGCLRPYPQECYVKVMGAHVPVQNAQTCDGECTAQQLSDLKTLVLKSQKKVI